MIGSRNDVFTMPRLRPLLWLVNPGIAVSPEVRDPLLRALFSTPQALLLAVLNGMVLNGVAVALHAGPAFVAYLVIDIVLSAIRMRFAVLAYRAVACGAPQPTDGYLISGVLWCGLQGCMSMTAMATGIPALQVVAAISSMAMVGAICTRNYPAPRFAFLLLALCDLPMVAGAVMSGNHWLLVLVPQTPMFLYVNRVVIRRLQDLAVVRLQAQRDIMTQTRQDPLTGLLNRGGLSERLALDDGAAARGFALFYLDLDGFKQINDTLGHAAGDRLLQEVGQRLRSCTRAGDIVARQGGDEFIIAAPRMGPVEAASFAAGIIRRITDHEYLLDGVAARIGISIGFACAPEDGVELDELQRKADAALYDSKRAGRGTHRRYSESAAPRASRRLQRPSAA
jgi:diguanylate cyclase (GGDEF)-like protein